MLGARRRVLGEEHPETLTSTNNLATTLADQCQVCRSGGNALRYRDAAAHARRRPVHKVCYKPRPPAATTVTSMLLRIVALSHMGQPERELPLACQRLLLGLGTSSKGAPRTRSVTQSARCRLAGHSHGTVPAARALNLTRKLLKVASWLDSATGRA